MEDVDVMAMCAEYYTKSRSLLDTDSKRKRGRPKRNMAKVSREIETTQGVKTDKGPINMAPTDQNGGRLMY